MVTMAATILAGAAGMRKEKNSPISISPVWSSSMA